MSAIQVGVRRLNLRLAPADVCGVSTELSCSRRRDELSPELVLVCPELREAAIAALPDRRALSDAPVTRSALPEYRLLRLAAPLESEEGNPRRLGGGVAVGVLAYTLQRAVVVAIEAVAVVGVVIGTLALIATFSS